MLHSFRSALGRRAAQWSSRECHFAQVRHAHGCPLALASRRERRVPRTCSPVSLQQLSITIGTAIASWLDYCMHYVGGSHCDTAGFNGNPTTKDGFSTSCCVWPHLYGREECLVAPSTRFTAHSGLDSVLLSKMSVRQMCPQDLPASAKRDIFRSVLATLADDEAPGRGNNCCSVSIASTARRQTTIPCRISGQQSCGDD